MTTHLDAAMKDATRVVDEAREKAGGAAHRARSALLDGLHAAASVVTTLRGLGLVDALGMMGLQRRRGPLVPVLSFGAGVLAGAAVALLVAPRSGAETRRRLAERFAGVHDEPAESAQPPAPVPRPDAVRRAENGNGKRTDSTQKI